MEPLMEPYTGAAYASQERCWRCNGSLWRLEPPVQGHWRWYCRVCQHLTLPRAEAERALRETPAGAVGVVVAVPFPVVLTPVQADA